MIVDEFSCIECGCRIEPWTARQARFQCPQCDQGYRSNYRYSLYRGAVVGLCVWLVSTLLVAGITGAWARVVLLSIELGLVLAFGIGWLVHRWSVRIEPL